MPRWEIQLRFRKGLPNFKQKNYNADVIEKYKRGYFIEWPVADKHKKNLYDYIDYYLDTTIKSDPKMISGKAFRAGLKAAVTTPFRLVPYFDSGVWGGHWMQDKFDLEQEKINFAWGFDGVPEENSIYLKFGDTIIETPAMNVVLYEPIKLLGEKNYARFGAEFPIRFDLLDTMGGQNLSLQVHPTTEFIKNNYGMTYTQDESYYILDADENSGVYLGLKENINHKQMVNDLKEAQNKKTKFDVKKYVNWYPAKKGDHFLIPAGTIHCAGANTVVLEISATPNIFTFKLWDWDRLGLDGLPRPINIDEGEQVIRWDRTTKWVNHNLVNLNEIVSTDEGYQEIKTGLSDLEFIETRVITTNKKVMCNNYGELNVLNLVAGDSLTIESPGNEFCPITIHYAETFIVPAYVNEYNLIPCKKEKIKVLKAFVKTV